MKPDNQLSNLGLHHDWDAKYGSILLSSNAFPRVFNRHCPCRKSSFWASWIAHSRVTRSTFSLQIWKRLRWFNPCNYPGAFWSLAVALRGASSLSTNLICEWVLLFSFLSHRNWNEVEMHDFLAVLFALISAYRYRGERGFLKATEEWKCVHLWFHCGPGMLTCPMQTWAWHRFLWDELTMRVIHGIGLIAINGVRVSVDNWRGRNSLRW